jgi:hypothetical protein
MILEYAKGHSIPYIIDSSNAYEQFWRGCYRQHKEVLKKLGLSSHHILHMRHQMIEMTDFVWEQVEDAEHRIVTIHHHEYSFCSCKFTALPKIIQHKLMQKIIQNMSGFQYPPSYQFIQKLVHDMVRHDDFKTVSIQTCLISKRKDIFVVSLSSKDDKRRQKQKNTTN